jgi:hypothetical protein
MTAVIFMGNSLPIWLAAACVRKTMRFKYGVKKPPPFGQAEIKAGAPGFEPR